MKDSLKLSQEPQGCIYSRTQLSVCVVESARFWHVLRVVASLVRACVCFPAAAGGLVPFNPSVSFICPLPYRKPQRSGSAVDGLFGVNRDLWESQRVKGGNSHALDPAAHPMSPQCMQRNRGKKGGGDTLVFDTSVNKEWRLLKTTEH